jgi:hypothetical protein
MEITLESILNKGQQLLAEEERLETERINDEAERRAQVEAQYLYTLLGFLQSILPGALHPYIDISKIKMDDNGHLDSRPWGVYLDVPGCIPVRVNVWLQRDNCGEWTKVGLMDEGQLNLPCISKRSGEDGGYVVKDYNRGTGYPLTRLAYVLAVAKRLQAEHDTYLAEIAAEAERRAEWLRELDERRAKKAAEPESTPEEIFMNAAMDLFGVMLDTSLSRKGITNA